MSPLRPEDLGRDADQRAAEMAHYRALVADPHWQWYVREQLLPAYEMWNRHLNQLRADTAWIQGRRVEVASIIERPYLALGLPTPLQRGREWLTPTVEPAPGPAPPAATHDTPTPRPSRHSDVAF